VVIPDFDQGKAGQIAVSDQCLGIGKSNDVVGTAMEDDGSELDCLDRTELFPGGTKQYKSRIADAHIHGERTTSARSNHNVGGMPVENVLRDAKRLGEILVRKLRIEDFVTIVSQEGGLYASGNGLPPVQEQNLHCRILRQNEQKGRLQWTPPKAIIASP
jgi:hypothetical protein